MTREEVERVIKNVEPYYPWKHEINYLRDHDQAQREEIARLREALTVLMEEKIDYMRLNNLGNAELTHSVALARQALTKEHHAALKAADV